MNFEFSVFILEFIDILLLKIDLNLVITIAKMTTLSQSDNLDQFSIIN